MKIIKLFLAAAVLSSALLCGCKKNGSDITAWLSADPVFSSAGKAVITISLSEKTTSEVVVVLGIGDAVDKGFKAVPAEAVVLENQVRISSGQFKGFTTVEIDTGVLGKDDDYQLVVTATSARGATLDPDNSTVKINVSRSSGGAEGLSLQSDWTATITEVGTDEIGDYIALSVSAPGSSYLAVEIFSDAEFQGQFGDAGLAGLVAAFEQELADHLATNSIEECLWLQSETIYVDYYYSGEAYCYIIDFDDSGKPTGKYGKVAVTIPELSADIPDFTPSLQSGWTASIFEVGTDSYGDYVLLDVSAPGCNYVFVDAYTDAELEKFYPGGDIKAMITDYATQIKQALASTTIDRVAYDPETEYVDVEYYGPGQMNFYIMDFADSGNPTGKYGVAALNVPELTSPSSASVRVRKAGPVVSRPLRNAPSVQRKTVRLGRTAE